MTVCSSCGAPSRESDRFCLKCGAEINANARLESANVDSFQHRETLGSRIGDFVVGHSKGLLIILGIAVIASIGALTAKDESSVTEDSSSPGYEMVRNLEASGAIETFKAITPEGGYDSEYSLNDGDGYIRFNGDGMEYQVPAYEDDMKRAIEREARQSGFGDVP
jgi:hypothetical protein